jgi:hypothetical protein
MMLKLLKFLVQPVLLEEDDDGNIIGERMVDPNVLYTSQALVEWAQEFDAALAASQEVKV